MKKKLSAFFFKDPSNWRFWLVIALLLKGIFFFLRVIQGSEDTWIIHGFYGYVAPDSSTYILPIEEFIRTGQYISATRMPGYGIIYLFFRMFCNQPMACNMLILLQYLLASVSVYVLAKLVLNITGKQNLFYLTFYIFLISFYSNYMDDALMTESLCTAFLIFGTYFFVQYFKSNKLSLLFFSGLMLTWVVFLRPVFISIFFLYLAYIVYFSVKQKMHFIKSILFFVTSFVIIDGAWVCRNYIIYKRPVILTGTIYNAPPYRQAAMKFIQAWGGKFSEGDDKEVLFWFGFRNGYSKNYNGEPNPFPSYIFTSKFNFDSLAKLQKMFTSVCDPSSTLTTEQRKTNADLIVSTLDAYSLSIKEEKPFLYYIKAPLIYLKYFLTFHWASYNVVGYSAYHRAILNAFNNLDYIMSKPFGRVNPINWMYKIFSYTILLFGMLGIFLLFKESFHNMLLLVFIVVPIYDIVGHALILRMMDNRYLLPSWPFIIICAAYTIHYLYNKFSSKNISKQ